MARQMSLPSSASQVVPRSQERALRIAIFDNLANSAYIQAKVLRRLGESADLVLDPLDRYAMSDPRWEDLDMELPTDELVDASLPDCELPVVGSPRARGSQPPGRRAHRTQRRTAARGSAHLAGVAVAARRAGWRGARMVLERAWVLRTLATYDCVIAYGMGPAWAALARVPFVAETWGGDVTMLPFYDTGDWEGHDTLALPGPRSELFAQARLQRLGYERAARILLTDPSLRSVRRAARAHREVRAPRIPDRYREVRSRAGA